MLYVPMLKTRTEELKVAKEMHSYFSDDIIPLFEVIRELYRITYKRNPNGEFVYEQRKKRKVKIKASPTEDDIVTLQSINDYIDGKLAFIDYFRFS